ncbi:kinetochore complex Fta4 of Sim4 subunit, or CENP-50-domain-containing protein [Cercophora scortea]|uniref:Kinetochore complex Fta4 of Sim4 subunit, or CENP-50-domain-containing protein n=1 Tax=Cercophora scortea TaxID=314031 RepID=A0AAE0IML1_9PEZI|nr:kinetochore complex Fta4 of Sim4 subunit, or CENP-50-domain-containing protein [Cercophora scortea]
MAPPKPAPPTVISLKQDFLTTQTRLLSQPLSAPTRAWRATNESDAAASLPEKAVDDALFRLNHRLQQHARRAYAPQATRHVAEQIDKLYWNAAGGGGEVHDGDEGGDDGVAEGLNFGADLVDSKVIATLPPTWGTDSAEHEREANAYPLEAGRYSDLVGQLQGLAAQKEEAAARVARLRRMQALLRPFTAVAESNGPGDAGIQENLVTRNGEVETELQRMRMLLARVSGRVSQLQEREDYSRIGEEAGTPVVGESGGVDVELDERRKVGQLLEMF